MRVIITLKNGRVIHTYIEEYKNTEDFQKDFKRRLKYQNGNELKGALSTKDSIIKWSEIAAIEQAM